MQEGFVTLLAWAGLLMTLLLGFLAIKVISGGLKRRASGLTEGLPQWPDVPAGWVGEGSEVRLADTPTAWPAGNWSDEIVRLCPKGHPERPHLTPQVAEQRHLLYLPGRMRGINGWWVLLLKETD